jgi:hypothetical protein
MVRIVVAGILLAHAIGHSLGLLQVFKVATVNPAWHGDSWILSDVVGIGPAQAIGVILWTLAIVGFIALAAVTMGWLPGEWFAPLAIASSLVSLAGVALFPLAFPTTSTIGAVVVDVVVLGAGLRSALIDSPA